MSQPASPVSADLLKILRCPETGKRLRLADAELISRINRAIATQSLSNVAGSVLKVEVTGALIREDEQIAYPIVEGIPRLLIDEGISLTAIKDGD